MLSTRRRRRLARRHRQLLRHGIRRSLRDQPLQLRNAGAAIGAGFQLDADIGGGTCTGGDAVADGGAADAEAGADDRAGIGETVGRFARQQHAALVGAQRIGGKQPLVLAVLDEANARLLERQAGMYTKPTRASDKWQQACDFYQEDLDSGFVKLLMELMAGSFHDEALRREFTPRLLAWQKLIEGAVDEFIGTNELKLKVSARAISAWITWFWTGMEASMVLGIPEHEGHQQEALKALALLLRQAEASKAPRKRKG